MIIKPTDINLIVKSYEYGERLGFLAGVAKVQNDDWIQRTLYEAMISDHWLNGNPTTVANEATTQITQQDIKDAIALAIGEKPTPKLSCSYNRKLAREPSVIRLTGV